MLYKGNVFEPIKEVTISDEENEKYENDDNAWRAFIKEKFEVELSEVSIGVKGDILRISKTARAQVIAFKGHETDEYDGFYYMNGNEGYFKREECEDAESFIEEWDMSKAEARKFEEISYKL